MGRSQVQILSGLGVPFGVVEVKPFLGIRNRNIKMESRYLRLRFLRFIWVRRGCKGKVPSWMEGDQEDSRTIPSREHSEVRTLYLFSLLNLSVLYSGIGRLIERRRKSRPVLRHMTFAGRSASRTSTLTAASLDDDTSSKNDPGPLEIHNSDHPPRTPLNNTIALPEASHQPEDVTVTTDVVRVSVGRQSVRLLPNGKLDIAFTPDSEKDTFWERPGEIGEDS